MAPPLLRFVPSQSHGTARKDQAVDSANRAHAARAAHARRRQERRDEMISLQVAWKHPRAQKRTIRPLRVKCDDPLKPNDTTNTDSSAGVDATVSLSKSHLMYRGNSDPFFTFPIKITPEVNQVLTFMRDGYFPMLYDNQKLQMKIDAKGLSTAGVGNGAWKFAVTQLSNTGIALACLASFLGNMTTMMSWSNNRRSIQLAQTFMVESTRLVKDLLRDISASPAARLPPAAIIHVYFLHRACTTVGGKQSSAVYGALLNRLLVRGVLEGAVSYTLLFQAGLNDVDAAAKYMHRPSLEYTWFARSCNKMWIGAKPGLATLPGGVHDGLHKQVLCEELRQAFVVSRLMNAYAEGKVHEIAQERSQEQKQFFFLLLGTESVWALGTSMRLYFDLRDDVYLHEVFTQVQRMIQAALALTLVFQLRSMAYGTKINGHDLRDYSPAIMAELRSIITEIHECDTDTESELGQYRDAHIWILFMGAFWEQRTNEEHSSSEGWFQNKLVDAALLAGISTWAELKPLLKSFAFADWDQPDGANWFESTVQNFVLRRFQTWEAELSHSTRPP
ncbi:hypothetical protein PV08_09039 [Exophiala spinifera]|uniref:Uncharacterized protein n=1 Tax=Exophiala spinifera TaxID=91928 RepID=A0A0D1ZFJ2_9EURO|nr:uncharacterized protein PV08_09039 [Exophiala spinifera]KIW11767.1 hypothetical protein PV08_09039 [Exophiala spinifera]